ncbi:MAG TPA: MFS transporter [Solirubrobacteraceae bacterium]|nr:MFS transporter [Solirubrobacteraceae bacterium]
MRRALSSATLPLYVGGFLGPFGGGAIAVLFPQLRDAFDATTGQVAAAIPAYFVPFAAVQLVSGTIGERLGRRRVVRAGYLVYGATTLAAAVAPTIGVFIVARAASGTANAFLTPLLLAGLAEVVPRDRLGRAVGTFAAVQTSAIALAPAVGGLLGEVDWRLAFIAPAAVAVTLAFFPPPDPERLPDAHPARWRAVLTRRVGLLSAAAFAAYAGVTSLGFLVALRCSDAFGLGSSARGAVLAGFGVAGMVTGRPAGRLVDRLGRISVTVAGAVACAVLVALIGAAGSIATLALLWLAAGAASSLIWAGLNTLTIEAVPANRAGATSVISAFKFAGNAAAPAMWLPLYANDVRLAFLAAGGASALVGAVTLRLR